MAKTNSKINVVTILFYILFIFLSLGQLGRISFLNQTINLFPHEIVMAIILLHFVITNREKISSLFLSEKKLLLFMGTMFVTFLFSIPRFVPNQNMIAAFYLIRLFFYLSFFILLRQIDKTVIRTALIIFTGLTILFSILQFFLYQNLRNLYYLGWDPHQYRLFGTMFDTTIMGIVLVALLFFVTADKEIRFKKIIQIILFILMLLTYSRITYISFLVGVIYYNASIGGLQLRSSHAPDVRSNNKLIVGGMVLFVFILFLLPRPGGEGVKLERIFSIESRIADSREALQLFLKNPILGVGYNHIKDIRKITNNIYPNHAFSNFSSSYMTLLVTTGIVGLIAFLNVLYDLFKRTGSLGKTALLIVLCASFFDNVILENFVLVLMITIISYSFFNTPKSDTVS